MKLFFGLAVCCVKTTWDRAAAELLGALRERPEIRAWTSERRNTQVTHSVSIRSCVWAGGAPCLFFKHLELKNRFRWVFGSTVCISMLLLIAIAELQLLKKRLVLFLWRQMIKLAKLKDRSCPKIELFRYWCQYQKMLPILPKMVVSESASTAVCALIRHHVIY